MGFVMGFVLGFVPGFCVVFGGFWGGFFVVGLGFCVAFDIVVFLGSDLHETALSAQCNIGGLFTKLFYCGHV